MQYDDKQIIECDIESAHERVQYARSFHIAGCLQHTAHQIHDLKNRERELERRKIKRSVAPDRIFGSEPRGQHTAYGSAQSGDGARKNRTHDDRLA